jgi:hypothetical protein
MGTIRIKTSHLLAAALIIFLYLAWVGQIPGFNLQDILSGYTKPTQPTTPTENLVDVNKKLEIHLMDKYAGSQFTSDTLTIYDTQLRVLESLTYDSTDKRYESSLSYKSGTTLYIKRVGGSGEIQWFNVVVPKMTPSDAQALEYNPITLETYDWSSLTVTVRDSLGHSYSDGDKWNKTANYPGTSIATCIVTWYQSTDNDGFLPSYDPVNQVNLEAWLVVKVSGTGYENVVLSGFPYSVEKGSAVYYAYKIPPETLTKWKVGNTYKLEGSGSFSFTIDLTGYSVNTAQIDIYIYTLADWNYFVAKGSMGPDAYAATFSGQPFTLYLRGSGS